MTFLTADMPGCSYSPLLPADLSLSHRVQDLSGGMQNLAS